MSKEPKKYTLFCNACGDQFIAVRSDARTCSPGCRLAISMLGKVIKQQETLSPADQQKFEESSIKVRAKESGLIQTLTFKKHDNDGPIVLPKAVIDQINAGKDPKPQAASKGKKIAKTPKNDKHLIPGKKNSKGLPVNKKGGKGE